MRVTPRGFAKNAFPEGGAHLLVLAYKHFNRHFSAGPSRAQLLKTSLGHASYLHQRPLLARGAGCVPGTPRPPAAAVCSTASRGKAWSGRGDEEG
jgi:hypothetical protein